MRLRLASVAFLLAIACTAISWGLLRSVLFRLLEAVGRSEPRLADQLRATLPGFLVLTVGLIFLLCFVVLLVTVARPLRATQEAIERIGRVELALPFEPTAGPLWANVQRSLRQMAEALARERERTTRQLDELRAAYHQLSRAQTELLAAERLATVGRLAAGVAHEIGNPLSGIFGYLSLLEGERPLPERREFLRRIEEELKRIDQIVRGLLDLGRPSRGQLAPVALLPLLQSAVSLVSRGAELREVKVELEVDPALVVRGEAGPISQVVINLLLNAAQAMGGPGTVRIRGARAAGLVELSVEDTGPGIPPEVLPRLFEPFFTTKEAGKGTGLGLAVCQHLLATMSGTLRAENGERGARFVVRLPAA